jgi:UDP-N-acetylglucosamine:LPS N-acetylglucosamine transferase
MKIMFILGSGGHTTRGIILGKQLDADVSYMVPWESEITKRKVGDNYFSVISPRFKAKDNRIISVIRTLFLFIHSLFILAIVRPNKLISTGSGLTLPPFLIARLFGIETVFIESPSRIYKPSKTGKLLMGKVDVWASSWKELADRFSEVTYGGLISDIYNDGDFIVPR